MDILAVVIIAAAVFGLCYLIDKGFTKLFRSQAQHMSGLSVRLNKRYGSIGLILAVVGIAAIFAGMNREGEWALIAGGGLVLLVGIGLVVYYMTFGLFYDQDGFVLSTFGRKRKTYLYKDIKAQQLYNNQGHILVELHLADGNTVQLQSTMTGAYDFLEYAFDLWLHQTGKRKEDCPFYDPENSCFFPPVEG